MGVGGGKGRGGSASLPAASSWHGANCPPSRPAVACRARGESGRGGDGIMEGDWDGDRGWDEKLQWGWGWDVGSAGWID